MQVKHVKAMRHYGAILAILCALLLINQALAYLPRGMWRTSISLLLPLIMAAILMIFCMHLKSSDALTRIFAISGFCWLALLFILSLTDFLTRAFVLPM